MENTTSRIPAPASGWGGTDDLLAETPYVWRARRTAPRWRLFCFPHAGAGASYFAEWAPLLPPEIELLAIQLPGRQNRIAEKPFTEVEPLVRTLVHALRPYLAGRTAFFGHCGGAVLAYELTQALHKAGVPGPAQLLLSGQRAPGQPATAPDLHGLPDAEFVAELMRLGGTEAAVAEGELMRTLLPVLRADFRLWEEHWPQPGPPVDVPMVALAGRNDPRTPADTLEAWRDHTTASFRQRLFDGGHFYLQDSARELVTVIADSLLGDPTTEVSR